MACRTGCDVFRSGVVSGREQRMKVNLIRHAFGATPSPVGKAFGLLAICSLGVTVTAVLMLFNRKVREI